MMILTFTFKILKYHMSCLFGFQTRIHVVYFVIIFIKSNKSNKVYCVIFIYIGFYNKCKFI